MKKSMLLGSPIYYFTDLSYDNYTYSDFIDSDEESSEIYYEYYNIKTGEDEKGVAFHNTPNYPTHIPAVQYALNVDEFGEGDYAINRSISYEECIGVYDSLLDRGVSPDEITVEMIKQEMEHKGKKL